MALLSRWGLRRRKPRPARGETVGFAPPLPVSVAFPAGVVSAPIDATSAPVTLPFALPSGDIGTPVAATAAPLALPLALPPSDATHPFTATAAPLPMPFSLPAGSTQFGNAFENAVLADGPTWMFRGDEPVGATQILDAVTGKTGTSLGSPSYANSTTAVSGKTTIEYPTVSDYHSVADDAVFDLGDYFALEFILGRVADTGTWQVVLDKGSGAYDVAISPQDELYLGKSVGPTLATAPNFPSDGSLRHVVINRGAVRGSGSTEVWINGALVSTEGDLAATLVDTALPLIIGRKQDAAVNPLRGRWQYLIGYKGKTLSPARIAAHFAQTTLSGGPPGLPIGGDQSLRGVKAYTLLTPTATVASPYGLTQVNAAIAAAGNGGIVRFPAAGSPYNFGFTLNQPNQRIQLETAATQVAGTVTVAASGITFEGGRVHRFLATRSAIAQTCTVRNVLINGSGYGIELQGSHHGWVVINCEFTVQTLDHIKLWYDQVADPDLQGFRVENCIFTRTVTDGTRRDAIAGQDGGNVNKIYDFVVKNCYFDLGSEALNWYGIEVWNCETSPTSGKGGIVEYCDIRSGGSFQMSMVRSRDNWVHRNIFRVNGNTRSVYECAGPTHVRGVFEYNQVIGASTHPERDVISVNSNPTGFIVRNNKVSDLVWLVEGWATGGGGFTVRDNCVTNVTNIIRPNSDWGIANDVGNNTGTACGW